MYPVDRIQKTVSGRHKKDEEEDSQTGYLFTTVYKNAGRKPAGGEENAGILML